MPGETSASQDDSHRRPRKPRLERVMGWLAGPRLTDPPIRVLAVIEAVAFLTPGSMESQEPLYLAFHCLCAALMAAAAFAPLGAGILAGLSFLAFLAAYPEYLDRFQLVIAFGAAVLLARRQWIPSLLLTASCFALTAFSDSIAPLHAMPYGLLGYVWLRNSLIALAAAAVETRLRREIRLREQAARDHERAELRREQTRQEHELELQRERIGFAVDAHDTVSHGLAQQSSIIRLLSATRDEREAKHLLSELALANFDVRRRLRAYLSRLNHANTGTAPPSSDPDRELQDLADALRRAAEVGGIPLHVDLDLPSSVVQSPRFGDISQALRELTTNMVKHAADSGDCVLTARMDSESGDAMVDSLNRVDGTIAEPPRSLALRAEALGGSCETRSGEGMYRVTVRLPV